MTNKLRAPKALDKFRSFTKPRIWGCEILEDRTNPAYVPTGAETLVNTFTTGNQQASAMAMDSNGNFVVVWESEGQLNGKDIYAQRYNASGVKQGAEFRVNTFTTGEQSGPDVAMDNNGNFAVVWTSVGQDSGTSSGVYMQRYNASGVAQGSETRLNNVTQYDQLDPSIAMDATGNFVVVWTSGTDDPLAFPAPQDGFGGLYGVYGIRYNSSGVRQGTTEFRVNNTTAGVQGLATVASDSSGNFTVVWTSTGQESGNGDSSAVYGRRYNSSGTALANEFRINQTTTGEQFSPDIAMNASGNWVVTWASNQDDQVNLRNDTFARRYNSSGVAQSNEFKVNTYIPGEQYLQATAIDTAGNFVVAWSSGYDNVPNPTPDIQQDGSMYGVYMQRYFANGTADGGEYRVNSVTPNNQWLPSIAMRASTGNFWISFSSYGQDTATSYGVYLEPYGPNTLPTASAGGPYNVTEGNSLVLAGSGTDPDFGQTLTYSWDVNGDGVYGDATGASPTLTWSQLQALGINDGPGSRTVRVRTNDGYDTTTSAGVTLTIVNGVPTAGISAQSAAVRGESINFAFTATDPSSVDQAASFTYAIDWNNDGITDLTQAGGSTLNVSYAYTAIGTYTARVRITDKDGGVSAWSSTNINVTRSRTAPNPNNGSLTDLYYGGSLGDDFIVAGAGNIYDSNAGPNSIFVVNFNTADPIELFPTVTGRILVYLQDGDDIFNTASVTLPTVQYGGNGADFLFGTIGSDTLDGGTGDDWIFGSLDGSTSPDLIFGGDGIDIILADGGNDTIDGGNDNDIIVGNEGNDSILGGGGLDFILAGAGADIIFGGAGDDLIIAGQYDPNQDLDGSVLDEWWSGDTYSNRVNHLLGNLAGGLNTQNLIAGDNVLNDSDVDTVYGQADQDFFFIDLQQDVASDVVFGEAVVDL